MPVLPAKPSFQLSAEGQEDVLSSRPTDELHAHGQAAVRDVDGK